MSFSEVSNQSWFGRLGGAFKGILVGLLLAAVAIGLLFWNEGRAVHRARTLAEGRGIVRAEVSPETIDPANEGQLVHMSGTAHSDATLADETFAITVDNAIKLVRHVEMYQWRENKETRKRKKLGGGRRTETTYRYEQVWSDQPIDSSGFHQEGKSTYRGGNPPMPYRTETWTAAEVHFGAFRLASSQVNSISNFQPVTLEEDHPFSSVDPEQQEKLAVVDNEYYRGQDPAMPQIGDLRIWFEYVGPSELSFVYQQTGDTFQPYKTKDGSISLFADGRQSADDLFSAAETANTMILWALRLAGFVIMAVGFGLVMRPLAVLGDVVPFLGGLVGFGIAVAAALMAGGISLVVIAVAWLLYRPLLAVILLAAATVLFFFARRFVGKKQQVLEVHQPVVVSD
jgi:hypothetical protein